MKERLEHRKQKEIDDLTKDQRTIFVSQLTKKVNEHNLESFFGQIGKVKSIILLRDKASGAHKGSGYVEMADLDSIPNCLLFNNVVPDFQKFPILVKASEAEKNFLAKQESTTVAGDISGTAGASNGSTGAVGGGTGAVINSGPSSEQKLYVGNLHTSLTESALRPLLEPYGPIESIMITRDHAGNSKGYAFVTFSHKESVQNALQTLGGTELLGRNLKVGPVLDQTQKAAMQLKAFSGAVDTGSISTASLPALGASVVPAPAGAATGALSLGGFTAAAIGAPAATAPAAAPQAETGNVWKLDDDNGQGRGLGLDSSSRIALMAKLGQAAGISVPVPPSITPAVGNTAAGTAAATAAGISGIPSIFVLISNMFDPATETGVDWELEIKEDVMDECAKHGQVEHIHVETQKPGGIVLLKFVAVDAAMKTAQSLNGRFFAGRMINVTYLQEATYRELLQ